MTHNQYVIQLSKEYSLRSFERTLALKEIEAILPPGSIYSVEEDQVVVRARAPLPEERLRRLAFADTAAGEDGLRVPTLQLMLNRLPKLAGNGHLSLGSSTLEHVRASRREHGYLTHGFHSYKGKYYPQIAASLLNWARLLPGDAILDPFCGSGTTLVEATLRGYRSVGVDLNPLATLISRVKCVVLTKNFNEIASNSMRLLDRIDRRIKLSRKPALAAFSDKNREYLARWFPQKALHEMGHALAEIVNASQVVADLFRVSLSDFLREISYQDPGSLRVLRRKGPPPLPHVSQRLRQHVLKRLAQLETLDALRPHLRGRIIPGLAICGDSRDLSQLLKSRDASQHFKAVVTSPPYATALPYIDTDRLSIFALGLLEVDNRTALELDMIGNREIREIDRKRYENDIESNADNLPESVVDLVGEICSLNKSRKVGFRRKNTASLLYKYFADMKRCLEGISAVTSPGSRIAVVVGNSSTLAGGKEKRIVRTDRLLVDICETSGMNLRHIESVPMTDQAAYMRHSRNYIRTESILLLERH